MQYPAIVVANEIIKLANSEKIDVTPMKLQKILYLANGIYYKKRGEKLIKEKFEAWDYGPVVRSVYTTYRDCKGNNISEPIDELIHTNGFSFTLSSNINVDDNDLSIIKEAWDNAKNLSAFTLSAWSHNKNSPWDKAYNSNPKPVYISDEDIKAYFDKVIPD
ncbi:Panacea domain-containing protein [Mucilaginibacter sp. X5P1]|uniref:Panacea domain-containing protein n=1 Tax=Mucilaginibacter sp. X5P1 TaxID=2723088 RepID=UPI0016177E51|nr:type II toxin-antitoxin system antitoxin SocA domain-containing protein [Mucilaginibacter sp. X5P1]MBB6141402.1 putative phage-associated protein [Mucilaginibacter sp. X5P1]